MNLFRAFISGIVIPSIVAPIVLYTAVCIGKPQLLQIPFIHLIPILWGIWNVLYFAICRHFLPKGPNLRYFLTGGSLGLLIAIYGVFWLDIPQLLNFEEFAYLPLVLAPIVYAILWRYGVRPLNHFLEEKG